MVYFSQDSIRKIGTPILFQQIIRSIIKSSIIGKIRPDVIAVGHDQDGIEREVRKAVAEKKYNIQVAKIGRFGKKELISSSRIMRKIIESFKR